MPALPPAPPAAPAPSRFRLGLRLPWRGTGGPNIAAAGAPPDINLALLAGVAFMPFVIATGFLADRAPEAAPARESGQVWIGTKDHPVSGLGSVSLRGGFDEAVQKPQVGRLLRPSL